MMNAVLRLAALLTILWKIVTAACTGGWLLSRGIKWSHLISKCSQKLDECSVTCARKICASARMLGFSRGNLLACKKGLGKLQIPLCVKPLTLTKLSELILQQTAYQTMHNWL